MKKLNLLIANSTERYIDRILLNWADYFNRKQLWTSK